MASSGANQRPTVLLHHRESHPGSAVSGVRWAVTPESGRLVEALAQAAAEIENVGTLVLFGSRAGVRPRENSDLDVAILPAETDAPGRRRLVARTASALAHLAPDGRVDVVLIDEAPELLRQRIFTHGLVVLQRRPAAWRACRVRTMREHGDREPYRCLLARAQRRRLVEGRFGGRSGRALDSLERTRRLSG